MLEMPKRILIADENQNIRDILKANLEVQRCEVLTSEDGEEALNLIYEKRPDIVILDTTIPRKDGFQICRQIKADQKYKDIPVIILLSKDQKEDQLWAKDCGADAYLSKPFITSELENLVKKYLEKDEAQKSRRKVSIAEEVKKKKKKNIPFALCRFELDSDSSLVFKQKYGEIRYSEMLDKVFDTIEEGTRQLGKKMIFEQEVENKFELLIEGKKENIKIEIEKIKKKINNLLKDFHNEDDLRKGFIRKITATGQEKKVPPLSIKVNLSFSKNKKSR